MHSFKVSIKETIHIIIFTAMLLNPLIWLTVTKKLSISQLHLPQGHLLSKPARWSYIRGLSVLVKCLYIYNILFIMQVTLKPLIYLWWCLLGIWMLCIHILYCWCDLTSTVISYSLENTIIRSKSIVFLLASKFSSEYFIS